MNAVVAALKPLRDDERKRVLEYVMVRFGTVPLQEALQRTQRESDSELLDFFLSQDFIDNFRHAEG